MQRAYVCVVTAVMWFESGACGRGGCTVVAFGWVGWLGWVESSGWLLGVVVCSAGVWAMACGVWLLVVVAGVGPRGAGGGKMAVSLRLRL